MYLHVGQNKMVAYPDIIALFDMDNTTQSKRTREFLNRGEKEGQLIDVSGDLPKSFVICQHKKEKPMIYLSQLSSSTLLRRVEEASFE